MSTAWNYTCDIVEPPSILSVTTCDLVSHRRLRPVLDRSAVGAPCPDHHIGYANFTAISRPAVESQPPYVVFLDTPINGPSH